MDKLDKTWFCTTNIQWTELVCEFTTVVELETFRGFNFCTVLKMTIPELELPSFNCFRFIIWKLARVFANHSKSLQNEVLLSIRFESRPHCWNLALKGAYCSVRVGQNMLLFCDLGNESTSESIPSAANSSKQFSELIEVVALRVVRDMQGSRWIEWTRTSIGLRFPLRIILRNRDLARSSLLRVESSRDRIDWLTLELRPPSRNQGGLRLPKSLTNVENHSQCGDENNSAESTDQFAVILSFFPTLQPLSPGLGLLSKDWTGFECSRCYRTVFTLPLLLLLFITSHVANYTTTDVSSFTPQGGMCGTWWPFGRVDSGLEGAYDLLESVFWVNLTATRVENSRIRSNYKANACSAKT